MSSNPISSTQQLHRQCPLAAVCSGCSEWGTSLADQQKNKVRDFLLQAKTQWGTQLPGPWPEVQVHSLGPGGLRDRLDFTLEDQRFGLKSKDKNQIIDLPECLQLSAELQDFLTEFRKVLPPIKKGSVRLRVYSNTDSNTDAKARGIWLDFANTDIQFLFTEQEALKKLLALAYVEVGQRRKKLVYSQQESRFRLEEPELHPWVSTYATTHTKAQEIPLYGYVSSFSQTGDLANRKISGLIEDLVRTVNPQSLFEFGAGLGTLTFPALAGASATAKLTAFEVDTLTLQGLQKSIQNQRLTESIQILQGDFQTPRDADLNVELIAESAELLLLNPPRSGIGKFLESTKVSANFKTRAIIYMSCFSQSLIADMAPLISQGFRPVQIHMIDQFPQSAHAEWLVLFQRPISKRLNAGPTACP